MTNTKFERSSLGELIRCTGVAAAWCPRCGDCECPTTEDGDRLSLDDPTCPLHSAESIHGHDSEDSIMCRPERYAAARGQLFVVVHPFVVDPWQAEQMGGRVFDAWETWRLYNPDVP